MLNLPTVQNTDDLKELVGAAYVLTDPSELKAWGKDWTSIYTPNPSLVVLPASTAEVSAVLAYCHAHRLPVVPSGGRTGLAGGAVACQGEVVVSLNRLNRILAVDRIGMSIVTQAGVTTQALQQEADRHDLFFPLDLAAKGSSQIGGNIATNAGGLKLIRFGGTREQVLGLEVVLADGSVLDLNTNLRKNNTGYDLKHLFIGSEGTLGLVTAATLRLVARPQHLQLTCLAMPSIQAILRLFELCPHHHLHVAAFEFFSLQAYRKVRQCFPQLKPPFAAEAPYYVLLEVEGEEATSLAQLEALLTTAWEEELVADAVVASSSAQFHELWALRENITESLASLAQVRKNDIALPIAALAAFVSDMEALLARKPYAPLALEVILFGHIGDGNLHLNYIAPKSIPSAEFTAAARATELEVFALLAKYRGSISAEHGIGLMRRDDLSFSRSPAEIQMMQGIRRLLDPVGILNPGKIF